MANYLIYWKNYQRDRLDYQLGRRNPLWDWRTNSEWLKREFVPLDRFWFVTAGDRCERQPATAAFLVGVFVATEMPLNEGDDEGYPAEEFRYTIWADKATCQWIDPRRVDELVRPNPQENPITVHIGGLIQGPRRLLVAVAQEFERLIAGWGERPAPGSPGLLPGGETG